MIVTAQQLIERPLPMQHVVLLGAGASRASFPAGDTLGHRLPLMDDLLDVLDLRRLVDQECPELRNERNFEVIYGQLISDPKFVHTAKAIERCIREYFSGLSLPGRSTIYDRILVSMRPTDAIFTFNWDPFLFDAYLRNRVAVPLPEIFFLHGNVRIGKCPNANHDKWGPTNAICPICSQMFVDVPLLYPIRQKDYSADPYIRRNWEAAKTIFREAFTLTIFGYGAPASDEDAVQLLKGAWINEQHPRIFEHIEIIDIAPPSILADRWSPFTPPHHYHFMTAFERSRIARWPRRVCESTFYSMTRGLPCEDFPLPSTGGIAELQAYAADIARHEGSQSIGLEQNR